MKLTYSHFLSFCPAALGKRKKTSFPVVCLTSIKPSVLSRAVKITTASEHYMSMCVCFTWQHSCSNMVAKGICKGQRERERGRMWGQLHRKKEGEIAKQCIGRYEPWAFRDRTRCWTMLLWCSVPHIWDYYCVPSITIGWNQKNSRLVFCLKSQK